MILTDLLAGDKARIISIKDENIAFQLLTKGIRPGMTFELKRKVLFGSSYYLKFDTHIMALRKTEAKLIEIEKL